MNILQKFPHVYTLSVDANTNTKSELDFYQSILVNELKCWDLY